VVDTPLESTGNTQLNAIRVSLFFVAGKNRFRSTPAWSNLQTHRTIFPAGLLFGSASDPMGDRLNNLRPANVCLG